MRAESSDLIIGISIEVVIGVILTVSALICFRYHRKSSQLRNRSRRRAATTTIPIRANGADSCTVLSDSSVGTESPKLTALNSVSMRLGGLKRAHSISSSGIHEDLLKATHNFTTLIGQGAYGLVYKAQTSTGETVAVKKLATDSKQGEKEFQTEVMLLGMLHHRNLVNLVGYCAEKGQHMLVYVYMSKGSLASHLYGEKHKPLSWNLRVQIAFDVARGLEYLHDGVAEFGLSREEMINRHATQIKGTFGYLDPEYVATRSFTKKSDVYSFGLLLFELIAGRNPQRGLMEYVELAAINTEGKNGWAEIVDSRLDGKYDAQELNEIASLAYKCVNRISRKRPYVRDIVQVITRTLKLRHNRKHHKHYLSPTADEFTINVDHIKQRSPSGNHPRVESMDSTVETLEA